MKDWEITEAYFLPRILCWRTTNTLPGNVPKPNLRFFSLSEDNQWTAWKSSDYFYPEIIPEPDYSDSADDSGEEAAYSSDRRSAIERLRDLTEVYVSNVSAMSSQNKTPAGAAPKSTPKQKPIPTAKEEENLMDKQQPPKTSAKTSTQKRSKSPTGKAAKPTATTTTKRTKSPQLTTKTAPKRKPSPKRKAESTTTADEPKTASADTKTSKAKPEIPKSASKRKTSPKPKPKAKAAIAESTTKAAGDARTKSAKSDAASLSSPATSGQSQSSETASSDEEQHLIKPRKPYAPSTDKQKLHKELKFSQKYGKLSSSKTELQLALERYTESKVRRELDAEEKSSLEKILEYQARKIEMQETMDKSPAWIKRLQRPPSTMSDPNKEEFFRVHARVVSSSVLTHCFLPDDESPTSDCLSLKTPSDSSSDS